MNNNNATAATTSASSSSSPKAFTYTDVLVEDSIGLIINGLAAFPGALLIIVMAFMLETQIAVPDAKLYFVLGFFLLMIPFYTINALCFPLEPPPSYEEMVAEAKKQGSESRG